MICKNCQQEIKGHGKFFCSRSCSAIFTNKNKIKTQETKNKISNRLKKNPSGCCAPGYVGIRGKPPTKIKIKKSKGGYRLKSSRGKQGWYKGYFLNSTYELAYIIYCLDHNEKPIRNSTTFFQYFNPKENKTRKFYPDFIINGTFLEIKNFRSEINDAKQKSAPNVKFLYKEDLKNIFNYVETKTKMKIDKLFQLYEMAPMKGIAPSNDC